MAAGGLVQSGCMPHAPRHLSYVRGRVRTNSNAGPSRATGMATELSMTAVILEKRGCVPYFVRLGLE